MKRCMKCGEIKEDSEFTVDRDKRDGLSPRCRSCIASYRKTPSAKAAQRRYRVSAEGQATAKAAEAKRWPRRREADRIYQNKPTRVAYRRRYQQRPDVVRRRRAWQKMRRQNPMHRLTSAVKNGIWYSLKLNGGKKTCLTFVALGYSIADLRRRLESQFLPGMTWDNYGSAWHVDHKRPIASFKFCSVEDPEFRVCWSLSNLQPLWKRDNLRKKDRYTPQTV